jgi:outer membrane protein OmpA-like peptidoglycan-associated protein
MAAVRTLEVKLAFNSVYFPTALPTKADMQGGLVPSQQRRLLELAANYKQYLELKPEAHLTLQSHADKRGSVAMNQALSERRAERVRSFLVEQGVPASNIETKSFGKEENLDAATVTKLSNENPNLSPGDRRRVQRNIAVFLLANNRRVDVVLSTTGQMSKQFFPYNSDDLNVLLGAPKPAAKGPAKKKAPVKK